MSDDPYADRRRLTFEQAEGIDPLPAQLKTKELSDKLRAMLWYVIFNSINENVQHIEYGPSYLADNWNSIFQEYKIFRLNEYIDEYKNDSEILIEIAKQKIVNGHYAEALGFVQFIMRHRHCPPQFSKHIDLILKEGRAAYRVLDEWTIIPITSDVELKTLERAIVDLAASEFRGARKHLHLAADQLTEGNFASSIRESVHAVESVARTLAPSGALREALANLEKSASIHPALKDGFNKIYGYTSDEKGIRHPLLDTPQSKVDDIDAIFMIGACASFVSYMINKGLTAKILK